MRPIDIDVKSLHWQRVDLGVYLDYNSFGYVEVLADVDSMDGEVRATVFFFTLPVLVVSSSPTEGDRGRYEWTVPTYKEDTTHGQTYVEFLQQIGEETDEEAVAFVAEHGLDEFWDSVHHTGDGHELIDFVGRIARGIHAAFPDDTEEPTGF
jgi:hypothetical protein